MGTPSAAKRRKKARQRHHATQSRPPLPRTQQLMDLGWSRHNAEHLVVLEMVLDLLPTHPESVGELAKIAVYALRWSPVLAGAQALYTSPDDAEAWRLLALHSDGEDRRGFLTLAAISEGKEVVTLERDGLTDLLDPGDAVMLDAARIAEAAGDFGKALDLVEGTLRPVEDAWSQELHHVLAHGSTLPAWKWGRVILAMAVRYVLEPRTVEVATHYASVVLQALGADAKSLREHVAARVVYDQVIHDALLFDEGGLLAFLDFRLAPEIAARCPGIEAWPDAQVGVWRLTGRMATGYAVMQDLVTGRTATVGDAATACDTPLADQHPIGQVFYGRLVRVEGEEPEYFAIIPTVIDELTASRVVRAVRDGVIAEKRLASSSSWRCSSSATLPW